MLQIKGLTVCFKHEELFNGLNLHVKKGEIVCIKGRSGSGKTTLLRAVMGFVPIKEGSIIVDDTLLTAQTAEAIRKKIAWMPQELTLPTEWVSDMIRLPLELRANRSCQTNKETLLYYFSLLGLGEELLKKRVNEISGGQRQKIMLAVTAMLDKKLTIVDEPTSALDPISCQQVTHFMQQILTKEKSILAVSHNPLFSEGCTRIIAL